MAIVATSTTVGALCTAIGYASRALIGLPTDPATQEALLAAAIRDEVAGRPWPTEPSPGRTSAEREVRRLVKTAFDELRHREHAVVEARTHRDALAGLLKHKASA